jgi:hypothetical protein
MKATKHLIVATIALLSSFSIAAAAGDIASNKNAAKDELSLTKEQEDTAWQDITRQARKERAPTQFVAKVGAVVPSALMTYPVPMTTSSKVSVLLRYQYALLDNNRLLIVNPRDQKIADVITR